MSTNDLKTVNEMARSREQIAASYVAKVFLDRMTDEDLQSLDAWLAESDKNHAEYEAALEAWNQLEQLNCEKAKSWKLLLAEARPERPHRRWIKWSAVAASVAMIFAIGAMLPVDQPAPENSEQLVRYETRTGEQQQVTLADGSTVTINTNSSVLIDFSDGRRQVNLERGEAFFEVKKKSTTPFCGQCR